MEDTPEYRKALAARLRLGERLPDGKATYRCPITKYITTLDGYRIVGNAYLAWWWQQSKGSVEDWYSAESIAQFLESE